VKDNRKILTKSKRRRDELDGLIKKLVEAFATGKIPEKHYEKLLADYDGEQEALEVKINELQTGIDAYAADSVRADKFIEIVKRYTRFTELTTPMLNEFVEKIIVHEADKSSGRRVQKVDIHLNFIGHFDTPYVEILPTPEEVEAAELEAKLKREANRIKYRERSRKWREKQRAKLASETAGNESAT
jgi:hypothetical protein